MSFLATDNRSAPPAGQQPPRFYRPLTTAVRCFRRTDRKPTLLPATRITPPPVLLSVAMAASLCALLSPPSLMMPVSLVTTLAVAGAVWRLLRTLEVPHAARWAAVTLALPATTLGTGVLGQVDAMWAAPCLLALYPAIRRRHGTMLLWCGLGFAVDTHALLFAPFVVAVLINRRVPPALWLLAAATVLALPLGGAWHDLATPFAQPSLGVGAVWSAVEAVLPVRSVQLAGLAVVATVGASAWYVARFAVQLPASPVRLLPVALLATLVTAGLVADRVEGCFVLGGTIAMVWAIAAQDRRAWHVAALIQAGSALTIGGDLSGQSVPAVVGLAALALATWLVVRPIVQPAANDNTPIAGAWRRGPLPPLPAM